MRKVNTEKELERALLAALVGKDWLTAAETFESADVVTDDRGLVVYAKGGAEFQVTIVQTK